MEWYGLLRWPDQTGGMVSNCVAYDVDVQHIPLLRWT